MTLPSHELCYQHLVGGPDLGEAVGLEDVGHDPRLAVAQLVGEVVPRAHGPLRAVLGRVGERARVEDHDGVALALHAARPLHVRGLPWGGS